jgi:hypothetical protein
MTLGRSAIISFIAPRGSNKPLKKSLLLIGVQSTPQNEPDQMVSEIIWSILQCRTNGAQTMLPTKYKRHSSVLNVLLSVLQQRTTAY